MEYREERSAGAVPRYVGRGIAAAVASSTAPVAILEGAHGVGKTALALNEAAFERFHYVTLADPAQLAQASADPGAWLASLPRPAVIDDAHRVGSLVDAARQAARKRRGKRPSFVLMSPVRLRWQGDRGPRPARFTLFPLTQAELAGRPGCIVDDLFDGAIARGFRNPCTRSDLRAMMRIGGLPERAVQPGRPLPCEGGGAWPFQADLDLMRADDVGPRTSVSDLVARSVLRAVLHQPGAPVSSEALARACHVDADALTAHLEELRDRFVIHRLSQLDRKRSRARPFTGARVHPMDTSLAVAGLLHGGHDIALEPPAFARALRTLCASQVVPAAQWAQEPTECLHWRRFEHRMREVDLVLAREGRIVGITVRNSLAASPGTIGALGRLAEDERFARGFIVYMGAFPRQLAENIWAIPVSALWEEAAFRQGDPSEEGGCALREGQGAQGNQGAQGSQCPQGA